MMRPLTADEQKVKNILLDVVEYTHKKYSETPTHLVLCALAYVYVSRCAQHGVEPSVIIKQILSAINDVKVVSVVAPASSQNNNPDQGTPA